MNSLTRQRTAESVRSWWSDNNPTGSNINLHALAKPLMKLMYHRQAMDYIAKHRGTPLSSRDVEIYASYLGFKYVSSATRTAVLRELIERCESNADTVADFLILYPPNTLLESRNADVRYLACRLLGTLASLRPNRIGTWAASVCKQLVSLLRDESENVRVETLCPLGWIASNSESAQAAVDAHVLDRVAELLESPNATVREQTCELLGALASHETTESAVLEANSCELLVTLLRDENPHVMGSATAALYRITKSPEGVQAALDANLLDHIAKLLESRGWYTRSLMCSMLTAHDGILATLVGGMHCKQLVSLLGQERNRYVVEALCSIAKSPEGAQAVVDAGVLDSVNYLLDSFSLPLQRKACKILGALASHGFTVSAVPGATPCVQLVSLLRFSWLHDDAVSTLAQISEHPEGVAAITATDFLAHVATLMESEDRVVQSQTCLILRNLCRY
ncbi:armadillo-type protein [Mycena vulgaris]|nr:armadillo-type protein [Mycena vulgaris]